MSHMLYLFSLVNIFIIFKIHRGSDNHIGYAEDKNRIILLFKLKLLKRLANTPILRIVFGC